MTTTEKKAAPAKTAKKAPAKAKAAELASVANVVLVPLDDLVVVENIREAMDEEGLAELARDIEARGLLQPIIVTPAKGNKYQIVAGHRRAAAVRRTAATAVPAVVLKMSGAEAKAAQLAENIQRQDLSLMEEGRALQALRDEGVSIGELADLVHKSRSWVEGHVHAAFHQLAMDFVLGDVGDDVVDALCSGDGDEQCQGGTCCATQVFEVRSPALLRGVAYRGNAGLLGVQEFEGGIRTREVFTWAVQDVERDHPVFGLEFEFDARPFGVAVAELFALLIDAQELAGEADRSTWRANAQQMQSHATLLKSSDISSTDPQMPPEARKEPVAVPPKRAQYMDKFRLLNKSEQELLQRLEEALPALRVFSQVSMSQLFHIGYRKDAFRQLGEIGRKSVDFLVCRRTDTSIVVAIELNGPTHEQEKQRISDEKKRAALEEAGIPLLVFYPNDLPDVATLRAAIAPFIVQRKQYEAERDERLGRQ